MQLHVVLLTTLLLLAMTPVSWSIDGRRAVARQPVAEARRRQLTSSRAGSFVVQFSCHCRRRRSNGSCLELATIALARLSVYVSVRLSVCLLVWLAALGRPSFG